MIHTPEDSGRLRHCQRQARYEPRQRVGVALYCSAVL